MFHLIALMANAQDRQYQRLLTSLSAELSRNCERCDGH